MLDNLIKLYYGELIKTVEKNAKLGDFIKMIELRHKTSPDGTDHKEFWKMLERIRRETLDEKPSKNAAAPARRKRTKKTEK